MCSDYRLLIRHIVRPVLLGQIAFVIPLRNIRRSWLSRINIPLRPQSHFIHNFNADFRFTCITTDDGHPGMATPIPAYFESLPYRDGEVPVRGCAVYPYLIRYVIGNHSRPNYALVILVSADKISNTDNNESETDFYSPQDMVCLKRAMLDHVGQGMFLSSDMSGPTLHNEIVRWIIDISGCTFRDDDMYIAGSVSNLCVQYFRYSCFPSCVYVDSCFTNQYYRDNDTYPCISTLLNWDIYGFRRPEVTEFHDMERFVYGMLYGNENFMRADDHAVRENVTDYYSNNCVEHYWAAKESILSIRVASPFSVERNRQRIQVQRGLREVDALPELCMLIALNREINDVLQRHHMMKADEVDMTKAEIAYYFNDNIFNLNELDNRMRFFLRRNNLEEQYGRVQNIMTPHRDILSRHYAQIITIVTLLVAFLTLIFTIIM
ncbi:MAG: hypothetical protein K2N35_11070 [Muribaculaceae bacterium]|nr:hypothetical protein [Muribaculaceae bacterium]